MTVTEDKIDSSSIRLSRAEIAWAAVFALSLVLIYFETFAWLINIWLKDKEYSHGFLVPAVSIYLIWRKRNLLFTRPVQPQLVAGGGMILMSGLLFLAGRSGAFVLAETVSFIFILIGLVIFIWGWDILKVLALPLAYLQFMIPWAEEIIDRIHHPFQLVSAWLGVVLLKVTGVPLLHDGRFIYLPNITLEVAKECSGIRFLTSVIALGLPLVYLTQTRWKRAIAVISSGVLITILANGLRVALAGTMAYRFDTALLHGPFHIFQGWFTAQVGFIAIIFINWRISQRSEPGELLLCDRWKSSPKEISNSAQSKGKGVRIKLAAIVFLCSIAAITYFHISPVPVPYITSGKPFPTVIDEWKGTDLAWIQGEMYFPGVDYQVVRRYSDGSGSEIYFYMGYFNVQKHGKSVVNFRANPLHHGESIFSSGIIAGPPRIESSNFKIDGVGYKAFTWYRLRSRYLAGRYYMKFNVILDSLVHGKNNAAVFFVAIRDVNEKSPEDWGRAKKFIEGIHKIVDSPIGDRK